MRSIATPNDSTKQSAILILCYTLHSTPHILFIKRSENPRDKHSGQISFPGGSKQKSDKNILHTAIRETYEEIGFLCNTENIVRKLSNLYIPVSNYLVSPFVAILETAPPSFVLQESEIAEIIEIPIEHLLQTKHSKTTLINNETIPYFSYHQHMRWGAPAMICAEFLQMIS
jgi:8-oxo-dGTP pyrophosphatase MutT (NUDIX family)